MYSRGYWGIQSIQHGDPDVKRQDSISLSLRQRPGSVWMARNLWHKTDRRIFTLIREILILECAARWVMSRLAMVVLIWIGNPEIVQTKLEWMQVLWRHPVKARNIIPCWLDCILDILHTKASGPCCTTLWPRSPLSHLESGYLPISCVHKVGT